MRTKSDPVAPPHGTDPASAPRCRRCQKVITSAEREIFFVQTGLCFWCAYVDTHG